jgi:phosphate transport system permease protein
VNMKKRLSKPRLVETLFLVLMGFSCVAVAAFLISILVTILAKGLPAMNWDILTKLPQGGYYLGKEGGILNAIVGSLYLAGGGTVLAFMVALPIAFGMNHFAPRSRWTAVVRLAMNVMWGIPTIVFGAFGFMLMIAIGMRASLLAGLLVLALLELPIMVLTIDEFMRMVPAEIEHAALAVGSTRLEVALRVVTRQILPGLVTALLLGFGRGIGDAASVLFTAGYTDRLPDSLLSPVASLPLAVFFQLNTPYPEVQQRAYAAALVLMIIVLITSLGSRWLTNHLGRYVIR